MVGIFPDRNSIICLVDAVLAEQYDEWVEGRRYLCLDVLTKSQDVGTTTDSDPKGVTETELQAISA